MQTEESMLREKLPTLAHTLSGFLNLWAMAHGRIFSGPRFNIIEIQWIIKWNVLIENIGSSSAIRVTICFLVTMC